MCILRYLDNLLLREQSVHWLRQNLSLTIRTLEGPGWALNVEKPALEPAQSLKYLDQILYTVQAKELPFSEKLGVSAEKSQVFFNSSFHEATGKMVATF